MNATQAQREARKRWGKAGHVFRERDGSVSVGEIVSHGGMQWFRVYGMGANFHAAFKQAGLEKGR